MPESLNFIVKSVFKSIKKGKFSNISNLAKLLAGLKNSPSFTETVVLIVDLLCEEILLDLVTNDFRKSQHRILMIKFFGELHCYHIIDHNLIFRMLFYLLFSNTDSFKVKLIWALLDTVKHMFLNFHYKEILKAFLTEFKRYILSKPGISIELEFLVMDLLEMFRLQKMKPDTVENVKKEVQSPEENKVFEDSSEGEKDFEEEYQMFIEEQIVNSKKNYEGIREKETPTIFCDGNSNGFKVLVKKNGKVLAKPVLLPKDDPLLVSSEERFKSQAAEREKLSRVVVDLHQRRLDEENK